MIRIPNKILRYTPEILTAVSVGGVIASNALFVHETKKEHPNYILPTAVSVATIVAIIASYRLNAKQKAALLSTLGVMGARCVEMRKQMTPEQQLSMDDLLIEAEMTKNSNKEVGEEQSLYYLPQYGVIFWATPEAVREGELATNQVYVYNNSVSISEFLEACGVENDIFDGNYDDIIKFNYDETKAYDFQHLNFRHIRRPLEKYNMVCNYIYINQVSLPIEKYDEVNWGE